MKKILYVVLAMLMLIAALAGCTSKINASSIDYPKAIAYDNHEAQLKVSEQNAVDDSIINSINGFTAESASAILSGEDGNVCYSPLSLYMALAMLSNGTSGETQDEILGLLNETDAEYLSEQMGKLFRLMYRDNDVSTFLMANSLWINSNYGVKQEFVDYTAEHFYAGANELDFNDENAGDAISGWISDNTKGLLEPEIETQPLEILYIINTVYLKDAWVHTFEKDATKDDEFTLTDGSVVETEFMHNSIEGEFACKDGFTSVHLGLMGTGGMTFVLPDEGVEISSLLKPELLESMMDYGDNESAIVNLSLPKFDFMSDFDLIQNLKDLGMLKAFDKEQADVSPITDEPYAFISKVNQGTTITVNEDGLEAAAYTYIVVEEDSCPSKTIEISFDRPFIFIVSSNEGVPMFIGVVQNPNE